MMNKHFDHWLVGTQLVGSGKLATQRIKENTNIANSGIQTQSLMKHHPLSMVLATKLSTYLRGVQCDIYS